MKGATTSEIVGIMLVIAVTFAFFVLIFPNILSIIVEGFSKAAAENVARQLSGLITISGSSAYKIKIDYTPTKEHTYKIEIKSRTIKVSPEKLPRYAEKASSTQSFAVDLNEYKGNNINHFTIEKNFEGESIYDFKAKKE